jgi:DNA-directed RNA polymerase specialized sigma subunit
MLQVYRESICAYQNKKMSLRQERRLILQAQKGCKKSVQEMVLRHIGFLLYRLHRKVIPPLLYKHRDDMVSLGVIILYDKIKTYNLNYRDKRGMRKRVRFVSYIWKRIDGFIIADAEQYLRLDEVWVPRFAALGLDSAFSMLCRLMMLYGSDEQRFRIRTDILDYCHPDEVY